MRILHLSSLYPPRQVGGAERVASMLAQIQAEKGHHVGAASLVPSPEHRSRDEANVERYPLSRGNLLWAEDSARYPGPIRILNKLCTVINYRSAKDFGDAIDDFRPDIVHTHSLVELPPLVWSTVSRRRIPLIHTLHDYDLLCVRASLFKDRPCTDRHIGCQFISKWKMLFQRGIDTVVGVSEAVLNKHIEYGCFSHLTADSRRVIWNPLASNASALRKHRPDQAGPLRFGFLGRLVPEKGLHVLIEACRLIGRGGWQLKVAGRAPASDTSLRVLAENLPIEFLGYVDAQPFLDEIDVLVVPSIWDEPFGLTVIEAYAAGVCVIGSAAGAVSELVRSVDERMLVIPNDATALAAKMRAVLMDRKNYLPRLDAIQRLVQRVHPHHIAEQYLQSYAETISRKCPRQGGREI